MNGGIKEVEREIGAVGRCKSLGRLMGRRPDKGYGNGMFGLG